MRASISWSTRAKTSAIDRTRECLAAVADMLSRIRVARRLDLLIAVRGKPRSILSDNRTALTSNAMLARTAAVGIDWALDLPLPISSTES